MSEAEQPQTETAQPVYQSTPTPMGDASYAMQTHPDAKIAELTAHLKASIDVMQETKDTDAERWAEAKAAQEAQSAQLATLMTEYEQRQREERTAKATADMEAFLASTRRPSKAHLLGQPSAQMAEKEGHEPGSFLYNLMLAKSHDYEEQAAGKAALREMGYIRQLAGAGTDNYGGYASGGPLIVANGGDIVGKATLGSTDATGGYIIPNNFVDTFIKPAAYRAWFRQICTNLFGVNGNVDQPFRNYTQNVNTRATVVAWGAQKTLTSLVYDNYTATMYTIARIYDVANQFLRQSRGAAEQDVMSELSDALLRGEGYYILRGSGSSEPYGVLTALDAAADLFDVSHTASNSTVAGSLATAIAKAAGALAGRGVEGGLAAVVNTANYYTALAQGSDTAGFWYAPQVQGGLAATQININGVNVNPGTLMTPWGIPVFPDINMEADHMIVGDWSKIKVYHGQDITIDTSDEAYDRWDKNLTGFRGEEEIALDARAAVYAGYFALIEDAVA